MTRAGSILVARQPAKRHSSVWADPDFGILWAGAARTVSLADAVASGPGQDPDFLSHKNPSFLILKGRCYLAFRTTFVENTYSKIRNIFCDQKIC